MDRAAAAYEAARTEAEEHGVAGDRATSQAQRAFVYAYYTDIAHFMAGLPLPDGAGSGAQWLGWEGPPRVRWRGLVMSRRRYLPSAR
ncbi:hypothetical protein OG775_25755 [Streptomyces platensis]|uniref:hypothetical protein n=1 Tax=Streptomyces TaxID=1883 RepID=UPI001B3C881F|nr:MULTISPECIES: hypothetical protein [Streptomyces]MCX4638484.1 hypothetical protein [Streptomyces platensis]